MTAMFDLRINGGILVDGSGAPGVPGDLAVKDGRIAALGRVEGKAEKTIDAGGAVVAPGFVDIHTHYDAQAFWDHTLSPSCMHGTTTIMGGNCGFSIAPLNGRREDAEYLMRMLARVEGMPLESLRTGVPWDWRTFGEYLGRLEGKLAINAGFMVGHSALRRSVMGERALTDRATADEIAAMQALLRDSLAAGGMGFSTTVSPSHNDGEGNPVPSRHAGEDELLALAQVAGEFPGTTLEFLPDATTMREEHQRLMTDMSLAAGRPLNWNVMHPDARIPEVTARQIAASDYAAARGARVVPLVGAKPNALWINLISGFVFDSFPGWGDVFRLPLPERMAYLRDPDNRRRLDGAVHANPSSMQSILARWENWQLAEVFAPANKPYEGKSIGEVARALGKTPFDTMLDIALADGLKTSLLVPPRGTDDASWELRAKMWLDGRTVVGASDAGAHLDMLDGFAGAPEFLRVGVRERKLLSLEEAVRQLTTVPAELYGLVGRGALKVGHWADVVVFDPGSIGCGKVHMRDDLPAGASRLYAEAEGIRNVLVNGREIVRGREFQGAFPGTILRSGRDTRTVSVPGAKR